MTVESSISEQYSWLGSLKKDPIPVLMAAAPLPIRYQVLKDLVGSINNEDLEALQKNLRKHEPRRRKLAEQGSNGLWSITGPIKGLDGQQIQTLQFIKQTETLHQLLDLMLTGKSTKAALGMREVIRSLAENSLPLRLHHVTQAVYLAISYKLDGNPIIKQTIRDIIGKQNPDGGWSSLDDEPESCLWSSLFFLWTMGHSEMFRQNRSLKKGLDYIRDSLLLPDRSRLLPGMQPWDTLISGNSGLSMLTGGSLRYLETMQLLADTSQDRKTGKLVDWLSEIQLKNGLWPSIVTRDKQGDHGVTLRVLRVLKHFRTQRIEQNLKYDAEN